MRSPELAEWAADKEQFLNLGDYIEFARRFLDFWQGGGFQAEIVAKNENVYRFLQYKDDSRYAVTRPINDTLMFRDDSFIDAAHEVGASLPDILNPTFHGEDTLAANLTRFIYTAQQAIGAALDAHPSPNAAKKINGDLFERLIGLMIEECGMDCSSGTLNVPIRDDDGVKLASMKYQHDLMLEIEGDLVAIGSVKTTSKDRIDKVFVDKYLYSKITGVSLPHFAIFLHDVQRAGKEPNYGVSSTFLPGHFKGYTIKLNPLDGVYYCDLRPNMRTDPLLKAQIRDIADFFLRDLSKFEASTIVPSGVKVEDEEDIVEATE